MLVSRCISGSVYANIFYSELQDFPELVCNIRLILLSSFGIINPSAPNKRYSAGPDSVYFARYEI